MRLYKLKANKYELNHPPSPPIRTSIIWIILLLENKSTQMPSSTRWRLWIHGTRKECPTQEFIKQSGIKNKKNKTMS